ncbi:hypothetical protein AKJ38_03560 [candidate division MSBL1 archaeon SCGC-AAA259I14]|uniref:Uncharacterized protein n=1 Tax=candidate division MSBL1 archaeon SCGC-AAA259I14 TaxID=1698268 RepID=A0A133UQ79_9EURY|nr:hypothetical protein AKJ38_03560 [candidate division MSBL1 archaeon SCGC-AAA259I14]
MIEACDAWQPVYDWLTEKGIDVKLAHPHKTRIIAEVKMKWIVRKCGLSLWETKKMIFHYH